MAARKTSVSARKRDAAVNKRYEAFALAYVSNGNNGQNAAITAGYAVRSARSTACRLLTNPNVAALVAAKYRELQRISGIDAERSFREIARIAYADRKDLYTDDGHLIPEHQLPADLRAAVSSYSDKAGVTTHDKLKALDMTMKHLGAYERDNLQRDDPVQIQVVLVGGGKSNPHTEHTATNRLRTEHQATEHSATNRLRTEHSATNRLRTEHQATDHQYTDDKYTDNQATDHQYTDHKHADGRPCTEDQVTDSTTSVLTARERPLW